MRGLIIPCTRLLAIVGCAPAIKDFAVDRRELRESEIFGAQSWLAGPRLGNSAMNESEGSRRILQEINSTLHYSKVFWNLL